MGAKKKQTILYDGQYYLSLEFTNDLVPPGGEYISPRGDEAGRITVTGDAPDFDIAVAVQHEINEHIAWTREAKTTFASHAALDYHAIRFMSLLQNSPKLAEYYYLFSKKGGRSL